MRVQKNTHSGSCGRLVCEKRHFPYPRFCLYHHLSPGVATEATPRFAGVTRFTVIAAMRVDEVVQTLCSSHQVAHPTHLALHQLAQSPSRRSCLPPLVRSYRTLSALTCASCPVIGGNACCCRLASRDLSGACPCLLFRRATSDAEAPRRVGKFLWPEPAMICEVPLRIVARRYALSPSSIAFAPDDKKRNSLAHSIICIPLSRQPRNTAGSDACVPVATWWRLPAATT